jgi:predicted enzyme related to lactoylglutathione lyase
MKTNFLRGMATVSYFAADHAAARRWYSTLLGTEPYFERPGYVEFRIGDYQAELGIIDSKYVPGVESGAQRAGVILYWAVDDVNVAYARLLELGATSHDGPRARGDSGFVTATVVDPFGNLLGVMNNPHYVEMLEKK